MQERYIYISCASQDREVVRPLVEKLKAMGFRVVFADGVVAGADWQEELIHKLRSSSCVVMFLSAEAMQSGEFRRELQFAIQEGKDVVTVCLEELQLTPGLAMQLGRQQMIRPGTEEDVLKQLTQTEAVRACREDVTAAPPPVTPVADDSWYCERCGQRNDGHSRFCRSCGGIRGQGTATFGAGAPAPCMPMYCEPVQQCEVRSEPAQQKQAQQRLLWEEKLRAERLEVMRREPPTPPSAPPLVTIPGLDVGLPGTSFSDASREIELPPTCAPSPLQQPMPCAPAPKPQTPAASAPTGKKPGFLDKLKGLFGGSQMSDVQFSVLAPASFARDSYTMVDVYAFEEAFRHVVEKAKAERTRQEGAIKESDGGCLQVQKGARITVQLSSPDLEIADNEESQVWAGKYAKFDFPVMVPGDYGKKQILFNAAVYFDGVIATRIRFTVACDSIAPQRPKLEQKDVRSAFISYASGDRERVALILQGMRRSRPDLDVFFDVETLKTGESWEYILRREIDKRDVLYLCWSQLAKESPWVEMEWRYALKQKGLDGIEPIPLVLPKDCPPPEELSSKHFGARELYYQ